MKVRVGQNLCKRLLRMLYNGPVAATKIGRNRGEVA